MQHQRVESPLATVRPVPTRVAADRLSAQLLRDVDHRLAHVRTAADVAERLGVLFAPFEAQLLVAAAALHDIGYAPAIARTGFHPLDGAVHLRELGCAERLCGLVAHHSHAALTAPAAGVDDLDRWFDREQSLLSDALVFADLHSCPDGRRTGIPERLADMASRHGERYSTQREAELLGSVQRVREALRERVSAGASAPQRRGAPRGAGGSRT